MLIEIGAHRLLTSGLQIKAENGIELLKRLQKIAENKLIILPGSGINSKNALLFKQAGFQEIHTSASKIIHTENSTFFDKNDQTISDISKIKEILKVIKNA